MEGTCECEASNFERLHSSKYYDSVRTIVNKPVMNIINFQIFCTRVGRAFPFLKY